MPCVERETGLSKSTIYALIKKGEFPEPIQLGQRASGWLSSEVHQRKQQRIAESRKSTTGNSPKPVGQILNDMDLPQKQNVGGAQ